MIYRHWTSVCDWDGGTILPYNSMLYLDDNGIFIYGTYRPHMETLPSSYFYTGNYKEFVWENNTILELTNVIEFNKFIDLNTNTETDTETVFKKHDLCDVATVKSICDGIEQSVIRSVLDAIITSIYNVNTCKDELFIMSKNGYYEVIEYTRPPISLRSGYCIW